MEALEIQRKTKEKGLPHFCHDLIFYHSHLVFCKAWGHSEDWNTSVKNRYGGKKANYKWNYNLVPLLPKLISCLGLQTRLPFTGNRSPCMRSKQKSIRPAFAAFCFALQQFFQSQVTDLPPCKNTFFQPVMSLSVFTWSWSSSEKYGILLKCSEGTCGGKNYLFPKPQREFLRENHTAKRAVVILGVIQGEHWYIFLSLHFSEYLWSATQPSPNPHPVALFVISSEQTSHTLFTKIILCVKPEEHYS